MPAPPCRDAPAAPRQCPRPAWIRPHGIGYTPAGSAPCPALATSRARARTCPHAHGLPRYRARRRPAPCYRTGWRLGTGHTVCPHACPGLGRPRVPRCTGTRPACPCPHAHGPPPHGHALATARPHRRAPSRADLPPRPRIRGKPAPTRTSNRWQTIVFSTWRILHTPGIRPLGGDSAPFIQCASG